jgi:hypothetical protein
MNRQVPGAAITFSGASTSSPSRRVSQSASAARPASSPSGAARSGMPSALALNTPVASS